MEEYLITATLLDSWKYLLTNEYGNLDNFISTLKREKQEQTQSQLDGFEFEDWAVANYEPTKGGQYQVKLSKPVQSSQGTRYLLYGRLDCLKNGRVYDYKHTSNYEVGKFFGRCQTACYLELVPEAKEMVYVIGKDKPAYQLKYEEENGEDFDPYTIYTETYTREEVKPIQEEISNFEEWLKTMKLWETYTEHWGSQKEKV